MRARWGHGKAVMLSSPFFKGVQVQLCRSCCSYELCFLAPCQVALCSATPPLLQKP